MHIFLLSNRVPPIKKIIVLKYLNFQRKLAGDFEKNTGPMINYDIVFEHLSNYDRNLKFSHLNVLIDGKIKKGRILSTKIASIKICQ